MTTNYTESDLITMVHALVAYAPSTLTPVSAGILAARYFDLAADSRSFAREMDMAHALIIRDCVALAEEENLIDIDHTRQDRSQRIFYTLSDTGRAFITAALKND